MSDDRVQYKFMIPESLKERLEELARENRRSLSAEIIERLEKSVPVTRSQAEEMLDAAKSRLLTAEMDALHIQRKLQQAQAEYERWAEEFAREREAKPKEAE